MDLSKMFEEFWDRGWLLGLVTKSGVCVDLDLDGLSGLTLRRSIVVGPEATVPVVWCLGLGLDVNVGNVGDELDLKLE